MIKPVYTACVLFFCLLPFACAQTEQQTHQIGFIWRASAAFAHGEVTELRKLMTAELQESRSVDSLQQLYVNELEGLGTFEDIVQVVQEPLVEDGNAYLRLAHKLAFAEREVWLSYVLDEAGKVFVFEFK